ncbi:hypothetical protein [Actinomadura rugatobispora]|uniref:Uncharacterized protein n=1 Tax=Actinomadura rugatobispora TaxID=1994 RepID=A0ABW1A407_9ACTN
MSAILTLLMAPLVALVVLLLMERLESALLAPSKREPGEPH